MSAMSTHDTLMIMAMLVNAVTHSHRPRSHAVPTAADIDNTATTVSSTDRFDS
jgi:hypothetical protein